MSREKVITLIPRGALEYDLPHKGTNFFVPHYLLVIGGEPPLAKYCLGSNSSFCQGSFFRL